MNIAAKSLTRSLEGMVLDFAVGYARYHDVEQEYHEYPMGQWFNPDGFPKDEPFTPSSNWVQGGELIEEEGITITLHEHDREGGMWSAYVYEPPPELIRGLSALEAAMRAYVYLRVGEYVDVPESLLNIVAAFTPIPNN